MTSKTSWLRFCIFGLLSLLVYWAGCHFLEARIADAGTIKLNYLNSIIGNPEYQGDSIVFLGDSSAAFSYLPNHLGNSVNLSLFGGTPVENQILLKRYLSAKRAPKVAVVSFSFSPRVNREKFWSVYVRSGFYGLGNFLETFAKADLDEYPHMPSAFWGRIVKYLGYRLHFLGMAEIQLRLRGLFNKNYMGSKAFFEELERQKGAYNCLSNEMDQRGNQYPHEFSPPALYLEYFEKLLDDLVRRNIAVLVKVTPVRAGPGRSQFYHDLKKYLDGLEVKFPTVRFYKVPEELSADKMCDSIHLSADGAKWYTKKLIKELVF